MYTDNMFWYGADTSAAAHSADPKLRERGRKVFMYEYAYRAVHSLVDMNPAAEVAQKCTFYHKIPKDSIKLTLFF